MGDAPPAPLPPHAYVPGRTARHPEDWFDPFKDIAPDPLNSPAMRIGLYYFHEGYFWECHEVLEAVWLALPDPSAERQMVQAVIQLANACLKLEMGKRRAAERLCDIVQGHLEKAAGAGVIPGFERETACQVLNKTRQQVKKMNKSA